MLSIDTACYSSQAGTHVAAGARQRGIKSYYSVTSSAFEPAGPGTQHRHRLLELASGGARRSGCHGKPGIPLRQRPRRRRQSAHELVRLYPHSLFTPELDLTIGGWRHGSPRVAARQRRQPARELVLHFFRIFARLISHLPGQLQMPQREFSSTAHGLVRLSLHVLFCNTNKIRHAMELCGAARCVQIVQNLALVTLTLWCQGSHTG